MPNADIEEQDLLDRLEIGDRLTMYATGVQDGFLTKKEDLIYPCNSEGIELRMGSVALKISLSTLALVSALF
jgi:hypothetical protein